MKRSGISTITLLPIKLWEIVNGAVLNWDVSLFVIQNKLYRSEETREERFKKTAREQGKRTYPNPALNGKKAHSSMNITVIQRVGFESYRNFNKVFLRMTCYIGRKSKKLKDMFLFFYDTIIRFFIVIVITTVFLVIIMLQW